MDICITNSKDGTNFYPSSIHGMLWVQTHFEESNWDTIFNKQAIIPSDQAKKLSKHAAEAGLTINCKQSIKCKFN